MGLVCSRCSSGEVNLQWEAAQMNARTIGSPSSPGDLRGLAGSIPGEVVIAEGFWMPGDGGGGIFHWTADSASPDNWGLTVVPNVAPRTGCWQRLVQGTGWSVRWFGATATGGTATEQDDTAAFQLAIDSVPINPDDPTLSGVKLAVPPGKYIIGDIHLDIPCWIEGSGCGSGFQSTILLVKGKKHGFIIDHLYTRRPGRPANPGGSSIISNLMIRGMNRVFAGDTDACGISSPLTLDGIRMYGAGTVRDVHIEQVGGNGITITSTYDGTSGACHGGPSEGNVETNANTWRISRCEIFRCGSAPDSTPDTGSGLSVIGFDCNGGCAENVVFYENFWFGSVDKANVCNTYINCLYEANGHLEGGAYVGRAALVDSPGNASTFVGCYVEDGGVSNFLNSNAVIVGGNMAGSQGVADVRTQRVGASRTRLFFVEDNTRARVALQVPDAAFNDGSALTFSYQQFDDFPYPVQPTWRLRRAKATPLTDRASEYTGESPYIEHSYVFDRCWVIQNADPGDPTIVPFGWTDVNNPRGAGHLFLAKPVINQQGHFSTRWTVEVPPGANPFAVDILNAAWLVPAAGSFLMASFALEVKPDQLPAAQVRIGCYAIDGNICRVNLHNDDPVHSVEVTVVAHFEQYKKWYGEGWY